MLETPPTAGAAAWQPEWERILMERQRMSCSQAGPRGPPWADVTVPGSLARWLPWHWYSLGGTGWCYDSRLDELNRCDSMRSASTRIGWNGISRPADAASGREELVLLFRVTLALSASTAASHSKCGKPSRNAACSRVAREAAAGCSFLSAPGQLL